MGVTNRHRLMTEGGERGQVDKDGRRHTNTSPLPLPSRTTGRLRSVDLLTGFPEKSECWVKERLSEKQLETSVGCLCSIPGCAADLSLMAAPRTQLIVDHRRDVWREAAVRRSGSLRLKTTLNSSFTFIFIQAGSVDPIGSDDGTTCESRPTRSKSGLNSAS